MKSSFVDQTIFGSKGNCLSACISSITNIPLHTIPNFSEYSNWFERANNGLYQNHKLGIIMIPDINNVRYTNREFVKFKSLYIVRCISYNDSKTGHFCVACGPEITIIHDPDNKRLGLKTFDYCLFIINLFEDAKGDTI